MDYAFDFTGYIVHNGKSKKFLIKEYCLVPIKNSQLQGRISGVVRPEYTWNELTFRTKNEYKFRFYKKYGIKYGEYDASLSQAISTIIHELRKARTIYLKNKSKQPLLEQFTKMVFDNVVCLSSKGYKQRPLIDPKVCSFHTNSSNRCSVQNAISMARWVVDKLHKSDNRLTKSKPENALGTIKRNLVYPGPSGASTEFLLDGDDDWSDFDATSRFREMNREESGSKNNLYSSSDDLMELDFRKPIKFNRQESNSGISDDSLEMDFENDDNREFYGDMPIDNLRKFRKVQNNRKERASWP